MRIQNNLALLEMLNFQKKSEVSTAMQLPDAQGNLRALRCWLKPGIKASNTFARQQGTQKSPRGFFHMLHVSAETPGLAESP